MTKRTITLLLVLAMAASMAACGGSASSDTTAPDTTPAPETSSLGFEKEDNGGREFKILVPTKMEIEYPMESNGEVVNDAIFDRNRKVEEYFNIDMVYQYEPGEWDDRDNYNNFFISSVMAGDSAYDMVTGYISCVTPAYLHDVFADLNAYDDLDLTNPWWIQELSEELSINNKLFVALGDANLSLYKNTVVTYFNKKVLGDYNLEDPYQLVRDGKWTMDKLFEMAEVVTADLDGDTFINYKKDRIGCYLQDVPLRFSGTALDVNLFKVGDDGKIFRDVSAVERLVEAYQFTRLFYDVDYLHNDEGYVDFMEFVSGLTEDRALFHISYLYVTESDLVRNMESDFGIVPYPKLYEQDSHITPISTSTNALYIPKTAKDIPLTCRVLEAMGYFSMTDVVPTYYEIALRDKYTRDTEVQEMLELIRDTMRLPFDACYGTTIQLQSGASNPSALLSWAKKEMASFYESKTAAWDSVIDKMNSIE
ncbi:MAG: extracellular solute-binding protein [Ruminococcaceae bacterium]|nr:extracellular solute-binding protein [Oscillospiraceae bacterium]